MDEKDVVAKVAEHDARIKSLEINQTSLIEKVDDIHDIASSVKLMANDMSYMKTDISEMKDNQATLTKSQEELKNEIIDVKNAPSQKTAKFMDDIKSKVFWLIGAGIIGYILAQLFPTIFK